MIQQYINSGILEAYVTGSASEQEVQELFRMKKQYPEIGAALHELEIDMEKLARHMAVVPPVRAWGRISEQIDDLILRPETDPDRFKDRTGHHGFNNPNNSQQYIEVEAESSHMKVHKAWKWVFAAVFLLGKIFLGCAIYFYLENRQAQQQLQEVKTELRQLKR